MGNLSKQDFCKRNLLLTIIGLLMSVSVFSQTLPTATEIANQMTVGWNVGNSLEVPDGETAWGNPVVNQQLIDSVKAAGFNVIRIPCAWNSYADPSTYIISPTWLSRVKEVVDYAYNNGMYVILNSHWDNGWLEENPTYSAQTEVNAKQESYWTEIANYFINYDEHLLFAGTNEVRVDYGTPSAENIEVQESYLQTFIDAVRATGGNNATRTLIVQTYNTNIWHGLNYFTLPNDPASNRLMVEIHHYDPYEFTISGSCNYWGSSFPDGGCSWANESYIEDMFAQLKTRWPDNGIPVIMGEYGAMRQAALLNDPTYVASREYWLEFNTSLAKSSGVIPVYWDNGYYDDNFALFNRSTGATLDQGGIDAIMIGAGVGGGPYTITTNTTGAGSINLNPAGGTYEVGTVVEITASADNGNYFSGWSGDLNGNENPVSITMSKDLNITAIFAQEGTGGTGTILREYWTGISGTSISGLTSNSNYPNNPTGSEQLSSFEGPTNWGDNYGARIRGYIHPITSGDYTFWIAGDDDTELYLSSDESTSNATLIASVNGWTNSKEWDKYSSQQSSAIALTAGQKYYIEVLHKEGSGGDNVAVAWQGPGISQEVISGIYLSPFDSGTPVNNAPIASLSATPTSGEPGLTVNFDASSSSDADGDLLSYSWDFGDGATGTGATTSHIYTIEGSFTVTLTVSDGSLTDTESISITVSTQNTGTTCDSPVSATLPLNLDGKATQCIEIAEDISYVNSWGTKTVEINGVDYTNIWSNSFPEKIDGKYYIYYKANSSWSHFEAVGTTKSAKVQNSIKNLGFKFYPNPFKESLTLQIANTEDIKQIIIIDQSGRVLQTLNKESIKNNMKIGKNLNPGFYFLQVIDSKEKNVYKLSKSE